jgi:hypothetical protein
MRINSTISQNPYVRLRLQVPELVPELSADAGPGDVHLQSSLEVFARVERRLFVGSDDRQEKQDGDHMHELNSCRSTGVNLPTAAIQDAGICVLSNSCPVAYGYSRTKHDHSARNPDATEPKIDKSAVSDAGRRQFL